GYSLFPGNYVAADMLNGTSTYVRHYTEKERKVFETYLQSRIDLVEIVNKDENFLRERILTMYANPVFNKQNALR
ncbi:MAG: acyltransferase, partial [Bacteroidaceae bacterium]|nr:acyltransferase [Bacteroidaceae bacterium]